jgi:hypothetical protein
VPARSLKETVAKPIVDDVLMAVQEADGKTPVRLSRGSPTRALPRVALDLATTVERIQSVRRWGRGGERGSPGGCWRGAAMHQGPAPAWRGGRAAVGRLSRAAAAEARQLAPCCATGQRQGSTGRRRACSLHFHVGTPPALTPRPCVHPLPRLRIL